MSPASSLGIFNRGASRRPQHSSLLLAYWSTGRCLPEELSSRYFLFCFLAHKYGVINGIASGSSSSAITLVYPTLSPVFSAPMGCSGISCPACSLRLFHSFLVSSTHVSPTQWLCSLSFFGDDVPYAASFPSGFLSNNPTSSASARGNEPPVFHQRVNCFLTVSLAPSHYPPRRCMSHKAFSTPLLASPFPFPVSEYMRGTGLISTLLHREELLVRHSFTAH